MEEQKQYVPELATTSELVNQYGKPLIKDEESKNKKQEYIQENKTEVSDDDLTTFPRPRSGCSKCNNGRGFTGWSLRDGLPDLCSCIMNRVGKVEKSECLTYGELRKILNTPKPPYPRDHTRPKSVRRAEYKANKLERRRKIRERKRNEFHS